MGSECILEDCLGTAWLVLKLFNPIRRVETAYWKRKIPISARIKRADIFLRIPVYLGPNFIGRYSDFRRKLKSISLPPHPYFNDELSLPHIEVTIDCTRKDLGLLTRVIHSVEKNTKNPISVIHIVVPSELLEDAMVMLSYEIFRNRINFLDENDVLSEELRGHIQSRFPSRYGWVIHQFLTLQQVLRSSTEGILSVDSDTMILRPMAFLNSTGVQVLMESLEYNRHYYEFLNKIDANLPIDTPSHVTHYSFFQKDILRDLLDRNQISDLEDFWDHIEKHADMENPSPFCIDREFYALGIRRYHSARFTLVKFANIGVDLKQILTRDLVDSLAESYNSVSAHSYLQKGVGG